MREKEREKEREREREREMVDWLVFNAESVVF